MSTKSLNKNSYRYKQIISNFYEYFDVDSPSAIAKLIGKSPQNFLKKTAEKQLADMFMWVVGQDDLKLPDLTKPNRELNLEPEQENYVDMKDTLMRIYDRLVLLENEVKKCRKECSELKKYARAGAE